MLYYTSAAPIAPEPPKERTVIMKNIVAFIRLLTPALLLSLCACSSLPRETLSPSDLKIEELEARMAKATDPEGQYAKAQSFVMRQELTTKRFLESPLVQMVETKFMRPDFFKITTYDDNKPTIAIISNGASSWVADYNAEKIRVLGPDELRQIKRLGEITRPGSKLSQIFPDIKVEKCRIGDELYYKLNCPGEKGFDLNIYVDADTYQTERITIVRDGEVTYDSSLTGYGLYEGVRIPEETSVKAGGTENTSHVIYYKLNAVIDPAEFHPPVF